MKYLVSCKLINDDSCIVKSSKSIEVKGTFTEDQLKTEIKNKISKDLESKTIVKEEIKLKETPEILGDLTFVYYTIRYTK
jgi:hypothetical protein